MSPLSRRRFLEVTAAGAALTIGVSLTGCGSGSSPSEDPEAAFTPDVWIRIMPDGEVVVVVDRAEMGQGVSTALPMLVAEELDADWSRVRYQFAPAHPAYYNQLIGAQITGGSTSVMNAWVPLREGAAKARAMLVAAAAAEWGVAPGDCRTERSAVIHDPSGRSLDYGAIAAAAGLLPVPDRVALKGSGEFRLIGQPVPRLDLERQVTGQIRYGIDVREPEGALVAVLARCPVFGGTVRDFDPAPALAVPGVKQVIQVDHGVAVLAENTWQAMAGRSALQVRWNEGPLARTSSEDIERQLRTLGDGPGREAHREGSGEDGLTVAAQVISAEYDLPFLAHACMEPMNCTALVTDQEVVVWVPTQNQAAPALFGGGSRGVAAKVAGVSQERVTVHTTNLGGGFGRRSETDFVAEAVGIAKAAGVPVRLVWSREDDTRHDFYRPISHHRLRGGLSAAGELSTWTHHIVAPSITARFIPGFVPDWITRLAGPLKGGVDESAVEGARDLPYRIPNSEIRYTMADLGVPVGFWRSVGHSYTAFVVESFIDELAAAAGKDPVAFRLGMLAGSPRHRAVLEVVATRAGWATQLPPGQGRGVAVHHSFGSYAAQVAEVEVVGGHVRVRRVVCAFDCGVVVNPDTVEAQIQSAIVYGLTAALKASVTLRNGRIVESNFHDYPLLRIDEMPVVDVVLVPSGDNPGGVGEPALPPIAPAVANAVFAATGYRSRRLPIRLPEA